MDTATSPQDEVGGPLVHVVARQRRENEHLRRALRTRAVIEQAKGIMVARTGTDPETAFRQLVAFSQRTNRKLVRVAAELVAHSITGASTAVGPGATDQLLEDATAWDAPALLAAAAVVAAPDLDQLLGAVLQHTSQYGVAAGMLALAEPDGALRIVGVHGYDERRTSGWRRVPPGTEVPLMVAAERRETVWCRERAEREERFPASRRFPGHREACVTVPLDAGRGLVGVLSLDWDRPTDLDPPMRRAIERVASWCAEPLAELLADYDDELPGIDFEPGRAPWFWSLLERQPIPQLVLDPIMAGGEVIDVTVLHANQAARDVTGLDAGVSLFEAAPQLGTSAFLEAIERSLGTEAASRVHARMPAAGGQPASPAEVTVARVGTSLVASWIAAG